MCSPSNLASLISIEDDLHQYGNYITPYAFKHIQDQAAFSDKVRIEERTSDNTFLVTKRDQTNVITSPISCQCNYLQRIGLPCRHIFKVRKLLGISRFDESLIVDWWKNSYANNGLTTELDTAIESDQPEDCFINIQDELPQRKILTEAQKYKKALKTAEALASVASEGGMKTFDERMMQMKALLESWQTGKPFHMVGASQHSIPRNVSEKIDELFAENDEALTDKESKTTSTSGKDKVAPRKNQRSSETQHCQNDETRTA